MSTWKMVIRSGKELMQIQPLVQILQWLCMAGQSAAAAAVTWLTARLIGALSDPSPAGEGWLLLSGEICGLLLFSELANSIFYYCMVCGDAAAARTLEQKLGEKAAVLPLLVMEDEQVLNQLQRAKSSIEQGRFSELLLSVENLAAEGLKTLGLLAVLMAFHPALAAISMGSVLPRFVTRLLRGKEFYRLKRFQAPLERKREYLYGLFANPRAVREMRLYGMAGYLEKKLWAVRDERNRQVWEFRKKDVRSMTGCELICRGGYLGSILLTIWLAVEGQVDFGMAAAALGSFSAFQTSAGYFLVSLGRMPECVAFVSDYYSFMDLRETENGTEKFPADFDAITANQVCFSYPGTKAAALRSVTFSVRKNQTVAIVGENGGGKTTLARLLLGIYQPAGGEIRYGDQQLEQTDRNDFYGNVSVLLQDFVRYELSARENVGISRWEALEETEEIDELLEGAGLADLAGSERREMVLGKEFGDRTLSGGQWQRLALARCMFRKGNILLLDEPTAALDPVAETEILNLFLELSRGKTAVIVSHRIGICRKVDRIIVMKDGQVAEMGNHETLLGMRGEYYRLYMAQRKWYAPEGRSSNGYEG